MELDGHALSVAVRALHVVAMSLALGGAVLLAILDEPAVATARRYEIVFWAAIAVLVMTGIGNLGAFGAVGIAPASSEWGRTFVTKMGGVLVLAALSLPRTLAIVDPAGGMRANALRRTYGATAVAIALVAFTGVVLAHG